jgi:hypothetical protein
MSNNEKVAEFIRTEWEVKRRMFESAVHSPLPFMPRPPDEPLPHNYTGISDNFVIHAPEDPQQSEP